MAFFQPDESTDDTRVRLLGMRHLVVASVAAACHVPLDAKRDVSAKQHVIRVLSQSLINSDVLNGLAESLQFASAASNVLKVFSNK